ncbi:MAG: PQQ-dependent sugar dehydrogenase [Candidatus Roizmanbacteria bacterium]|nr:PQQ-dependent sugar dehydrogenase [Candidatus Roizmanbacteria bacterium]
MSKTLLILLALAATFFVYTQSQKTAPQAPLQPKTVTTPDATASYRVETVVSGLQVPWSILFTGPNRMLVSERTGSIRVIRNGTLLPEPLHTFTDTLQGGERGLLGMTLHPDYANNKLVYAGYTYDSNGTTHVKIVRFADQGTSISPMTTIMDSIPGGSNHDGIRLKFGPDGKLYASTGEGGNKELAQQDTTYAGKIIRMDADGGNIEIYAKGIRNSQGFDWDTEHNNNLWAVDHGPSGYDAPPGGDEVNLITKGGNYGWPLVSHEKNKPGLIAPKITFTPAIAPASIIVYNSTVLPQFQGNLFVGGLRGSGVYRFILTKDGTGIASWEKLNKVDVGRVRDVVQGPDGYIYFTSSNRDGRGIERPNDDKIYRLMPTP